MTATTDSGFYRLPEPPLAGMSQEYRVVVTKPGYLTATTFARPALGDLRMQGVASRLTLDRAVITLEPAGGTMARSSRTTQTSPRGTGVGYWDKSVKTGDTTGHTYLTALISRTRRASLDFTFRKGAQTHIGYGISENAGPFTVGAEYTKTLTSNGGIDFHPWRWRAGTQWVATKIYFDAIVPAGINGGESYTATQKSARVPNRNYCSGALFKGTPQWIESGEASTLSGAASVYGIGLTAQTGFDSTAKTKIRASRGTVMVCGLNGPALTKPGLPIAVSG